MWKRKKKRSKLWKDIDAIRTFLTKRNANTMIDGLINLACRGANPKGILRLLFLTPTMDYVSKEIQGGSYYIEHMKVSFLFTLLFIFYGEMMHSL